MHRPPSTRFLEEPRLPLELSAVPAESERPPAGSGMAAPPLRVVLLAAVLLLPFKSVPAVAQTKKFCLTQFAIASQACAILPPTSPEHRDDDDEEDEDEDEDNDEDEDEDNDEDGGDDDSGGGGDDSGGGGRHRVRVRGPDKKAGGGVVSKPDGASSKLAPASSMITVEAAEVDAEDDDRNGTRSSVGNHTRSDGGDGGGSIHRRRHHGSRRRHRRRRHRHRRGRLRDGEDGGEDEDEDNDEDEDEDNDEDEDEDEDEDDDDDDDDDGRRAYRDCCRWLKEVEPDCVCQALLRLPSFLVKPQHKYTVRVGHSCKFTYRCGGV